MTGPLPLLDRQVDSLLAAMDARDLQGFSDAVSGIGLAVPGSTPDAVQAALARLEPALGLPFGIAGDLAQLVGSMAEHGTDTAVVVPTLVDRAAEAMESAALFAELYRAALGEPPSPDAHDQIGPTLQRFVGLAGEHGLDEREAELLVQAWFCADDWVQPVLYLCQRADVRTTLPQRDRLTAAIEPVRELYGGTPHWLAGLLLVLDDEPLLVLDRGFAGTGRGYHVTIGGIGDNFQLHTLLAAALIGDPSRGLLPGRPPATAEVAAAGTGDDLQPVGGLRGNWNLVDAYGEWIWNEGRPADIPRLDGVRLVVLDSEPYPRTWNAGRQYPLMAPLLRVDGLVEPAEAAGWLSRVKPSTR